VGPIGSPKIWLTNYQSTVHIIPEKQRPHLHCSGILKAYKDTLFTHVDTEACPKHVIKLRRHLKGKERKGKAIMQRDDRNV
jgi:hypothetical protein